MQKGDLDCKYITYNLLIFKSSTLVFDIVICHGEGVLKGGI